ncbi:hypothetical protein C8Q76DRAFT_595551, partial [Earliella scabrosa]
KTWSAIASMTQETHNDKIRQWNTELDFFLVYSSISSAILAGFNVQAYPLLLSPSSTDSNVTDSTAYVALNVLWFSSMICSLGATADGVIVKQLLHRYYAGGKENTRGAARRVYVNSARMSMWHVDSMI